MYIGLHQIQSTIQQIVMAIAAVLKIEVEVADSKLFRIAGTGLIKQKIWQEMSGEDAVYRQCVEKGESIIIDKPGFHNICTVCPHYGHCIEYGEICTPIKIDNHVIGVIGLIAFNTEQRQKLFNDLEANIYFIKKMAEVIASKVNETIIFKQQLVSEKKISTLINCIDTGIMVINDKGECEFISKIAKEMLNLNGNPSRDRAIVSQFVQQKNKNASGSIVWINMGNYQKKFFVSYHQIDVFDKDEAGVIRIEDPDHITTIASHISIEKQNVAELIGTDDRIVKIRQILQKIKDEAIPILIRGEDGTGKTFVAHYVHALCQKPEEKFKKINCSYYSADELNRLLFGTHAKSGAQTGYIERLDGGTLVLDEIDQLAHSTQLLLTKFMSEKIIQTKDGIRKVSLRLISMTNKNLMDLIQKGLFRQDLYYKIGVVPIMMPALRTRKDDIMALAIHFLNLLNAKSEEVQQKTFAGQVDDLMRAYDWPGNIQELYNVIEYAFNLANEPTIRVRHFPDYVLAKYQTASKKTNQNYNLNVMEREIIKKALIKVKTEGRKKEDAAQLLGIGRATLFRKIAQHHLKV